MKKYLRPSVSRCYITGKMYTRLNTLASKYDVLESFSCIKSAWIHIIRPEFISLELQNRCQRAESNMATDTIRYDTILSFSLKLVRVLARLCSINTQIGHSDYTNSRNLHINSNNRETYHMTSSDSHLDWQPQQHWLIKKKNIFNKSYCIAGRY